METHPLSIADLKKELRATLRSMLNVLTHDRKRIADSSFRNFCSLSEFRHATTIGIYIDFKTEIPTTPFIPNLFENQELNVQTVATPYCVGNEMHFHRLCVPSIDSTTGKITFFDLAPSQSYGILEPTLEYQNNPTYYVEPSSIDFMIIPGLGFDRQGGRLGRGAGYYDRYLPLLRRDATLAGYCYDEQLVDMIPTERFDKPVDVIVTPTQIIVPHKGIRV